MQTLQVNNREKLKKKGIIVSEVERRAGLNKTTVQSILLRRSRSPGIDIISVLAKEVECAVDELISPESEVKPPKAAKLDWYDTALIRAIQYVSAFLKERSINCSLEAVINCATEIYAYSLRANLKDNIDEQFAEWIAERHFLGYSSWNAYKASCI